MRLHAARFDIERDDLRAWSLRAVRSVQNVSGCRLVAHDAPPVARPLRAAAVPSDFGQPSESCTVSTEHIDGRRLQQVPRGPGPARLGVTIGTERDPCAVRRPTGTEIA